MDRNRTDRVSRVINAPPDAVYRAFTTPDAFMAWLPPEGMTGEVFDFDFREGAGYHMRLTMNEPGGAGGKTTVDADDVVVRFVKLLPDARIAQEVTFDSDDPRFTGVMKMTWSFEPLAEGTEVVVTAEDVPVGITAEDHHAGLASTLENLARFVEQED